MKLYNKETKKISGIALFIILTILLILGLIFK
jgi:Tfp pilus assembly protein PilX